LEEVNWIGLAPDGDNLGIVVNPYTYGSCMSGPSNITLL